MAPRRVPAAAVPGGSRRAPAARPRKVLYAVLHADGRHGLYPEWGGEDGAQAAAKGSSGVRCKGFEEPLEDARAAAGAWLAAARAGVDDLRRPAAGGGATPTRSDSPAGGDSGDSGGARARADAAALPTIELYVDGSFTKLSKPYAGWGWVAVEGRTYLADGREDAPGREVAAGCGRTDAPAASRNIDGELEAALRALAWWEGRRGRWPRAVVVHDYMGIREWVLSTWRAESEVARAYVAATATRHADVAARRLAFRHVRGHTGDRWNDRADALAKAGGGDPLEM